MMAFSNPEYMTLNEINESVSKFKRDLTSTAISTPICSGTMKRRPVPLPPPPSIAPMPPQSPPPLVSRTKLYQNIDHFNHHLIDHNNQKEIKSPIHVNCDFFSTPAKKSNKENVNLLIATNNNNSFSYLNSNINNTTTTSDSSSATMIIKKSPTYYKSSISSSGSCQYDSVDDNVLSCNKTEKENSKLIGSLLSPIMTSSRADLNSFNNLMSRVAIHLNNEIQEDVEEDEDEKLTTLINNKTPPSVFIYASSNRHDINDKLITNSLPCKRTRQYQFDRLNFTQQELINNNNDQQIETTLINNNIKSFNNYNYELVQLNGENEYDTTTSPNLSSVDSLILLPPSPFKSIEIPQSKSNIKTVDSVSRSAKKVSFLIREPHHTRNIEQYYYDEVFEEQDQDEFLIDEQDLHHLRQRRHSLSSGSSSSCSTNSSINTGSNSILKSKIVFSNNHYFISSDKQQSSDSSSSSSIPVSSASSCSSTSSSSSGYKSNQSASASIHQSNNTKYMSSFGPTELDQFIKISRDRLERLKLKRFQLVSENNLIEQKDEFIQFDTLKRKENNSIITNLKPITGSNYVDNVLFKNVSAKLFQKLLNNKSNSPCNTLPRRAK